MTELKTLNDLGSNAGLGAAVLVDGKVVAWFAEFDEAAEEWCTENHFGRWLTWRAKSPEIVPATPDEIANAQQRADDLAALFEALPEAPNACGEPGLTEPGKD